MEPDARPRDIHRKIVELIESGGPLAVAVVLATEGSTPQRPGAKAAIDAAGGLCGTVGGGAVEAEAQRVAIEACRSQRPVVFDFQMDHDDAADAGAICGGRMRILVDPTAARHRARYLAAAEAIERRERGVLVTTIRGGADTEVQVEWLSEDAIASRATFLGGELIRSCLEQDRPQRFVDDFPPKTEQAGSWAETGQAGSLPYGVEVFVEPIVPRPLLVIAGGGHVGQALAALAVQIGFDVTVIDDRPEFTDPAFFPQGVSVCCGPVPQQIGACPMGRDTYVVLVTRGHRQDAEALAACIHQRPAYLGMIGSRRKVALIRKHFLESGLATEEEFSRVCAPIGLSIGAVTVPEIAVSIAAQLIASRRKK